MLTSVVFLLFASLSPVFASVDSSTPTLGQCFVYQLAFPEGPDNTGLSLPLCELLKASLEEFPCDMDGPFGKMTGGDFVDQYSEGQAQFCTNNAQLVASVLAGNHPEGMLILETALAEDMYLLNAKQTPELRRRLGVGQWIRDHPVWSMVIIFTVLTAIVLGSAYAVMYAVTRVAVAAAAMGRRRRALSASAASNILVKPADILQECSQGSFHSFLCGLPVDQLLEIFTTGACATTIGLTCILNQQEILAALGDH